MLELIDISIDHGITLFDTADIYGQGDSERLLARALAARSGCIVGTKVGQRFSWKSRLVRPLKKPVAILARHSKRLRSSLALQRAGILPRDFRRPYVRGAVESSLRRLRRHFVEIVYLHSPSAEEIRSGEGLDELQALHDNGKIKLVGVACDTPNVAEECLKDRRVAVLQVPFGLHTRDFQGVIDQARKQNVSLIAREVFRNARYSDGSITRDQIAECVRFAVAAQGVETALVGTTSADHLREILSAALTKVAE